MTALLNVHLVTLGCARNEVDSEELAARLEAGGFRLVDDAAEADTVMVNTCGFVEQAKKDSVDTLLEAADLKQGGRTQKVVAVGCMAERYGRELAESLPEADAVLGFDSYGDIAERLGVILAGGNVEAHAPRDRRTLLPLSPVQRPDAEARVAVPGHATTDLPDGLAPATGPRTLRKRLGNSPYAALKIASGCDRRCAFCAIPRFRGSYLSRPHAELVEEARWLVDHGVHEVFLVSENTSSYGKDLGDARALEKLLVDLDQIDGLDWIRVSYLQPAEIRPTLIQTMTQVPKVVPYFDLSFQHASGPLLRRMRRFGNAENFLGLIEMVRNAAPEAGIRSNFIAGFPGETEADFETLKQFMMDARLDVTGVFGYSDEDNTEGERLDGHLPSELIEERAAELTELADELCTQRAEDRVGSITQVLLESQDEAGNWVGRALFQGPEVDGVTTLIDGGGPAADRSASGRQVGDIVMVHVESNDGIDLNATEVCDD